LTSYDTYILVKEIKILIEGLSKGRLSP